MRTFATQSFGTVKCFRVLCSIWLSTVVALLWVTLNPNSNNGSNDHQQSMSTFNLSSTKQRPRGIFRWPLPSTQAPGQPMAPRVPMAPGGSRGNGPRQRKSNVNQNDPRPKIRQRLFLDAVITFVNGSDLEFKRSLQQHLRNRDGNSKDILRLAADEGRFAQHNDLKILLRSLDSFAKRQFRRIFIVVASKSQIPDWLNLAHPQIKIVYHSDIWADKNQLPTFNSLAIEANLHRIPDLSPYFVYFNDDITLLNHISIHDFLDFSNGAIHGVRYRYQTVDLPMNCNLTHDDAHWMAPAIKTRDLVKQFCYQNSQMNFGHPPNFGLMPSHTPHLLNRGVLDFFDDQPEISRALEQTRRSRFRSSENVNTVMLFTLIAMCRFGGRFKEAPLASRQEMLYLQMSDDWLHWNFEKMRQNFEQKRGKGTLKFLCLNDVPGKEYVSSIGAATKVENNVLRNDPLRGAATRESVYRWRDQLFPSKSPYEK